MVTTIYVVRHCQSQGNVEGRFQGRFDAPVSDVGRKQLDLLSLRFRNVQLDAICASPLTRAKETAEAVNRFHQLPLELLPAFTEIDVGLLENKKFSEIAVEFPETAKNWDESPDLCVFPKGETMKEVYDRVNKGLDELVEKYRGKTVFLATHGGVLRNIYARVCFGCPEGIRKSGVCGNTGVNIIKAAEDGSLSIALWNDQSHLPEDMRKPPMKYSFHSSGKESVGGAPV